MLSALLRITRPHNQSALGVRGRYREFLGALIPPVQAMDKRSCHLRIEFKIKVAHGWISIVLQQGWVGGSRSRAHGIGMPMRWSGSRELVQSDRRGLDAI